LDTIRLAATVTPAASLVEIAGPEMPISSLAVISRDPVIASARMP
jgi:hypothetical protein